MEKLLDILQYLRKRLFFIDGLVVLLVLSETIYCAFVKAIGCHIAILLRASDHPETIGYCRLLYIVGFLVTPILAWLFWRRLRAVPRCNKDELAIVFAPNAGPETQEVLDRLFVHLTQEIKSREFGIRFRIKRLPPNLSIDSSEDATAILREARAVVAIWGPVEQQQSTQGKTTGFSKLSVTFIHRPAQIHPLRQEALAMSLVERQLHVNERTQIADQRIVAKDIGIIVRNLLGVALLINRRHADAVKILGPLHQDLQQAFPKKQSLPVQRFRMQVQYDLAFALTMATGDQYRQWLIKGKIFEIPETTLAGWIQNVKQAAALDPQNSIHCLSEAIYLFLSGAVPEAIKVEKKADQLAPRAAAVANLGLAFLYNFVGDFRRSREQYRLGLAKKTSYDEEMIRQCLDFITQSVKQFPHKKQLRLALGVLQFHRGSVAQARETLQSLLDNPPAGQEFQGFVDEARHLLMESVNRPAE